MKNMLHFWSPFLKIKKRTAELISTILVLDINSLQIFFWNKRKKGRLCDWKIAKSPLKSGLFKFKSHPHGVFGVWHLLKSHYEKWVQKSPEALRHLGFLGWHPLRMHNMVAEAGFEPTTFGLWARRATGLLHSAIWWCRKPGSNRYEKLISRDFKSRASANSAIPASMRPCFPSHCLNIIALGAPKVNTFFRFS